MKKTLTITAVVLMAMVACKKPHHPPTTPQGFITIDSANKMISSYLNSVQFPMNDSAVRCFTFDADQLRFLLDSLPQSATVKKVQIKFGHTLEYINNGHANQFAGYNNDALTLLVAGVNAQGNYVYANNEIMNHSQPCPNNCPPGNASAPVYVR